MHTGGVIVVVCWEFQGPLDYFSQTWFEFLPGVFLDFHCALLVFKTADIVDIRYPREFPQIRNEGISDEQRLIAISHHQQPDLF